MSERIEPPRLLDELGRLCAHLRRALPGESVPCFAHLRIESVDPAGATRVRDLLLGFRTFSSDAVTLINWQTAPLAEVYFSCREGEEYELSVGGRELGGTVLARSLLTFHGGELVEVQTAGGRFCRRPPLAGQPEAPWRWAGPAPALLQPHRGGGRAAPPWSPQALDPEQRRAVELPPGQALLVLGEAGCGKTTVALHRLAALHRAAQGAGRPLRSLLLVPAASAGLRHLCTALLGRLGVSEAEVEVEGFDRWAGRQARRAFPRLPARESQDVPAGVVAIKRHPGLLPVLKELAARRRSAGRAGATRPDLLHLFGDRALLERLAADPAPATVSGEAVRQVLEHTRVQFSPTTEEASPHIDADRLVTVDGRRIDEGTPTADAGSIDAEDYAVLFALAAVRAAPGSAGPSPTQYDCVVVDEAQEFAPIELMLIGRALRPGGTLIVAGDEAQQVDPSAYFAGFAALMQGLRAPDFTTVELAISYRCPPAVTELARTLRQPGPAAAVPLAASDAVVQAGFPSECHLLARLGDALRALREAEPKVTVAVICRTAPAAERLARLLARGVEARLARDGEFRFSAPIEVTCVQEVKGLEFDYVVIPDATALSYPEDAAARRALYVAVTRAAQQLLLCGIGTFSPLLPGRATPEGEPAAS
jgi:energy-coupling factor transporter ATP-binding protein EcfA2